uniref:Phospholipase A2 inhibitor and Ly6/PLAUR domain-containing protein-like n=1 Tax=Naja naja TaxID=35670 RepID=A0A8C6X3H0_NAJNA
MASLSSLIFLLATLLTQGSCLTCVTCRGPGTDCTGVRRTCGETEDTCLTFVGINSLSVSEKTIETIKVCSDSRSCRAGPVSVTINSEIHFRSISSCCQGDLCNNKKLDIPPENTTLNGLTCPACFDLVSDQCNTVGTLKCVGEDNHCITTSGTIAAGDIPVKLVSRGCSSASACALPLDTDIYSAGITFLLKKIECTQP